MTVPGEQTFDRQVGAQKHATEHAASIRPPVRGSEQGIRRSDRAYAQIRNGILRGDIPVGTVLAENELAESLGISRTPVRAALRLLLQEDLVEIGRRRQLVVRGVTQERRDEVFTLREALEPVAARRAAQLMAIDDIDQLRVLIVRQRRAASAAELGDFLDLDEQFHVNIALGAQLPTLAKFLTQLRAFIRLMAIDAVAHQGRMARVIDEHEAIIGALEARQSEAAVAAMSSHLHATADVVGSP